MARYQAPEDGSTTGLGSQTLYKYYTPTTVTMFAAVLLCLARFTIRLRVKRFGSDDYMMAGALVSALIQYAMFIVGAQYGLGRHVLDLNMANLKATTRSMLVFYQSYSLASTLVRLSIIVMLCRLVQKGERWYRGLQCLAALNILLAIASTVVNWTQCTPGKALWNLEFSAANCINFNFLGNWFIGTTACYFASDAILSVLPLLILQSLNRRRSEKTATAVLMSAGMLCSIVVVPKLVCLVHWSETLDFTLKLGEIELWMVLEVNLGICTACAPTLKSATYRLCRRIRKRCLGGGNTELSSGDPDCERNHQYHADLESQTCTEDSGATRVETVDLSLQQLKTGQIVLREDCEKIMEVQEVQDVTKVVEVQETATTVMEVHDAVAVIKVHELATMEEQDVVTMSDEVQRPPSRPRLVRKDSDTLGQLDLSMYSPHRLSVILQSPVEVEGIRGPL